MPAPQVDLLLEEEAPWVQVWSDDGKQLLFINSERCAGRLPETQRWPPRSDDRDRVVSDGG
jgi:hypothetical protein